MSIYSHNMKHLDYKSIKDHNKSLSESTDASTLDSDFKKKDKIKLSDLRMESRQRNDEGKSLVLSWYDDKGFVATVLVDTIPASDGYKWFGSFRVSKKYRGSGLGDQIMNLITSSKYKAGALSVYKDNEVAINLYKKHGFKISKERTNDEYYFMYLEKNRYKSAINESSIVSNIDSDYHSKNKMYLDRFDKVNISKDSIAKYKSNFKALSHIKDNSIGYIYIDDSNVVGFIALEKKENDQIWIQGLEINTDYQGHGLGNQLLEKAIKMHAKYLSVNKKNEVAIKMYEKHGFKTYKETDTMYFMSTESSIQESYLINEPDILYNKDKFDSGEINLCFITGHSGSGKSTLAHSKESDKIEVYELDDLWCVADHFSMDNLKEYGDLIYSYFNGPGKKFYITYKELVDNKVDSTEYEDKIYNDFVDYSKKYAKIHKDKKYIVEGIYFFGIKTGGTAPLFTPQEFKDYAFYIKGTSAIISTIRASKRDSSDAKNKRDQIKAFARMITNKSSLKSRLLNEKRINVFRDYFKKLIKKEKEK